VQVISTRNKLCGIIVYSPPAPTVTPNPFMGSYGGSLYPQSQVAQASTTPPPMPNGTTGGTTPGGAGANPYPPGSMEAMWYMIQQGGGSTAISPYQQAQLDADKWQFTETQKRLQEQSTAEQKWRETQASQSAAQQQAQLAAQQAQIAAEQAWRTQQIENDKQQRLATLAAQPKSWLEYAALSNQAPVVQPWMLPLMPQEYMQQAGSPIQGWTAQNMKGMPDLINPSAQYMARLSPSMKEQYQQADQGMSAQDTQWAMWNQGPSGGVKNLTQQR
jgi:hypothetical protein